MEYVGDVRGLKLPPMSKSSKYHSLSKVTSSWGSLLKNQLPEASINARSRVVMTLAIVHLNSSSIN